MSENTPEVDVEAIRARLDAATPGPWRYGRLHFHHPDGHRSTANAGAPSVLIAYGPASAAALQSTTVPGTYLPIPEETRT